MAGQLVGYARVSSADQNLDRQIAALGEVDRLFVRRCPLQRARDRSLKSLWRTCAMETPCS